MKNLLHPRNSSRQGLALILVVSILGLMTLLVLALFSLSETELKGARHYANGQQAKNLGDIAVNVAMAQLRNGTTQNTTASGREIWISQPGMIRRYASTGQLQRAFKLYSSSKMQVAGGVSAEAGLRQDAPPADWDARPERYVDLNRPVVRTGADGQPRLRFPVIDPRAMDGTINAVSGFSYSASQADGSALHGVVTTGGDAQRLPMPVEWLYVLKDGSLGALDEDNTFVGTMAATRSNPIVGRIAFWTDDESSKVNINTASEPTYWSSPVFFHEREWDWALYQPVNGEFQRYPGHPATTALSPILFPGKGLTTQDKTLAQRKAAFLDKERIYRLVPKIGEGGTKGATVTFKDPNIAAVELGASRRERLYASLDELLLKEDRLVNDFGTLQSNPVDVLEAIQRTSFFLTAHSRAPESNPFGQPKVAAWPFNYRGSEYRSPFDAVIAFCSTLKKAEGERLYMFQRGYADSATADILRPENQQILKYLLNLLQRPIPGFAQTADDNFLEKYRKSADRNDLPQVLVEVFDYIRSVNLHDGYLAARQSMPQGAEGGGETQNIFLGYSTNQANLRSFDFRTFTDPRVEDPANGNDLYSYPGHGQVTPARWDLEGVSYQGFGRFPTISEAGLHFICNADNTDDPATDLNPFTKEYDNMGKPGGGSAARLAKSPFNDPVLGGDRWYSNFPPLPKPNPARGEAADLAKYPKTSGFPYGPDPTHPGYQRKNWNWQLEPNKPLKPNFRRVQARMLLEFFVPAAGFTLIEPEITVKVKGLSQFTLNGNALFPQDEVTVYSGRRTQANGTTQKGGYDLGVKAFVLEREAPARAPMPADKSWGVANWQVKPAAGGANQKLSVLNYDLLSNFIDINVGPAGGKKMDISPAILEVEIYSGHVGRDVLDATLEMPAEKVQTIHLSFPQNSVKAPTLVRNPIEAAGSGDTDESDDPAAAADGPPEAEPPYWWSFYQRGALGFDLDALVKGSPVGPIGGRYGGGNNAPLRAYDSGGGNEPRKGVFIYGFSHRGTGVPFPIRPKRHGQAAAGVAKAEEAEGSDVVQTLLVRHGDYRLTAALPVVPSDHFRPHRYWGTQRLAHNLSNQVPQQIPGYDFGGTADYDDRLVPNATDQVYANNRVPDFPYFADHEPALKAHRYYDFDNAVGPSRDGPFINKPDEGNLDRKQTVSYFLAPARMESSGENFFTPNRQISSPVMFGSLPVGVKAEDPWRTLLFRPQAGHPGEDTPPDHLLLEFFWMPVVEPYAISEPFSTAGKINLNWQILPFTNIKRASGLHAVLESELITAVPDSDMGDYKRWNGGSGKYWKGTEKTWHYKVDAGKTLAQFEERFNLGRAYLSPSEICAVHLVPKDAGVDHYSEMEAFWSTHRLTGDNTRERPYANLYPRLTTRSNTFRVHFVTQVISKARSTDPARVEAADRAVGEFRGSTVIERYLDPSQKGLPDFAESYSSESLDAYHQFRVIETKKFGS